MGGRFLCRDAGAASSRLQIIYETGLTESVYGVSLPADLKT
jgi:hypothetical protein